ncbi:DNA translocase FtsK [Bartonella sp. LJL80]
MRNLKTNPVSPHTQTDSADAAASQQTPPVLDKAASLAYPTVWKKAFALGQNVRFTRTPEVELLRRRIENEPGFAEKLKAFEQAEQKRRENAARNHIEVIEPQQVTASASGPIEAQPVSVVSTVEAAAMPTAPSGAPLQADASNTVENANMVETVAASSTKPIYLSDSAFFEFGPFVWDQQEPAVAGIPEPAATTVTMRADATEIAPEPEGSITDLYRVLECRFSHANQSPINQIPVSAGKPVDAAPVLAQPMQESVVAPSAAMVSEPATIVVDSHETTPSPAVENAVEQPENQPTADHEQQAVTMDSAPLVEDIAPVMPIAAAKPEDAAPLAEKPAVEAMVERKDVVVAPLATTEVTAAKATISAPFRTLNPAFIASPKGRDYGPYTFPSVDLLQQPVYKDGAVISQETLERSAGLLESVLEDFGVKGEIIHVRPGPVVTMYEFEPAAGVKSSRVIGLSDDIARSMSAISARVAVIPGRNVIGIELPNAVRETVYLRELIQSKPFQDSSYKLALALGKSIGGEPVIAELAKMPHLLVAGTTGSGKSVAINTMILSLLYRMTPEQCRLIMVDPKMLELSIYDGIPHLLTPVVTDPKKAVTALKWAVREMEDRYRKMAKLGVRNIDGFNARVATAAEKGETIMCTVQSGFDKETGEMLYHEEAMDLAQLPYIVVIVDEMADLMMVAGKEIEGAIQRLAQMARAAGIHLIMATQRPSVDVITGTIKANFPTRISFQVTSKIDSRTILGEQGAETLLGQGDMLHMVGGGRIVRVHGPFVSDEEVEHVVAHLKTQGTPDYLATVTDGEEDEDSSIDDADSIADIVAAGNAGEDGEELYLQAVKVVMRDKKCSTSYIQRRLGIGYNKAASLVERMEEEGIVGAANHVGKREILLNGRNGQDSHHS